MTIRVSQDVLDGAKRYAREHGTTLTRLVTVYLERLGKEGDSFESAPVTRGLVGSLPPGATRTEYLEHLQQRHA